MEPIRLVCRRSEEVGSFKVRSHILPMNGLAGRIQSCLSREERLESLSCRASSMRTIKRGILTV